MSHRWTETASRESESFFIGRGWICSPLQPWPHPYRVRLSLRPSWSTPQSQGTNRSIAPPSPRGWVRFPLAVAVHWNVGGHRFSKQVHQPLTVGHPLVYGEGGSCEPSNGTCNELTATTGVREFTFCSKFCSMETPPFEQIKCPSLRHPLSCRLDSRTPTPPHHP